MYSHLLAPVSAGGHTMRWKFTHMTLNCLKIYSLLSLFTALTVMFRYIVAVWCEAVLIIIFASEQSGLSKRPISVLYHHKLHAGSFSFTGVETEISLEHWKKVSYAYLFICSVSFVNQISTSSSLITVILFLYFLSLVKVVLTCPSESYNNFSFLSMKPSYWIIVVQFNQIWIWSLIWLLKLNPFGSPFKSL